VDEVDQKYYGDGYVGLTINNKEEKFFQIGKGLRLGILCSPAV
jgi:hypothetical protein